LSIRSDGTFAKIETKGGRILPQRTITYTGEYKTGNDGPHGEFILFIVFDANCTDDSDVSETYREEGGWSFTCKYGFTSDGRLMLMDIYGNKSGRIKGVDDIFPSWEFYNRL
jgi:hypothetical protein